VRSREYADVLLHKAAQDAFALDKLVPDPESPNEIIGFHAQQAVEKLLKAVLSFHGIDFRHTHDLVELIDLVEANGIPCPDYVHESRRLNAVAAIFRYDRLTPDDAAAFERMWAGAGVRKTTRWAEEIVGAGN